MLYSVSRQINLKYGKIIEISKKEGGEYETPFQAYNKAVTLRRLWMEEGAIKIKILVDSKLLTVSQAENWANEEYKMLPKCQMCNAILNGIVYTHRLSKNYLFCRQECADNHCHFELEKLNDEEDCECL